MSQDMLVVDYDPFAMDSRVLVLQDGERAVLNTCSDLPELSQALLNYSREYKISQMKIHAPVNFFYELQRMVQEEELNLYNENIINMEIC